MLGPGLTYPIVKFHGQIGRLFSRNGILVTYPGVPVSDLSCPPSYQPPPIMSNRVPVDFDSVWREVNSPNFVGVSPTNEYDRGTVSELATLLQKGRNILNNPVGLDRNEIEHLTARLRQVKAEIVQQAPLVRNLSR